MTSTCDTCKHWDRQPDHVFQPTQYQKPVGPPQVTVFGICRSGFLACGVSHPTENGLTSDYGYHIGGDTDISTGPKFGCVHWEANSPRCPFCEDIVSTPGICWQCEKEMESQSTEQP